MFDLRKNMRKKTRNEKKVIFYVFGLRKMKV